MKYLKAIKIYFTDKIFQKKSFFSIEKKVIINGNYYDDRRKNLNKT